MARQKSIWAILILLSLIAFRGQTFGGSRQQTPDWYSSLPDDYKPISTDAIRQLENMRIRYQATHQNMFLTVMSTSWACEKAQYSSLKQLKQQLAGTNQTEKELWKQVLLGRFQTWETTLSLHAQELNWDAGKLESFSRKIKDLTQKADEIVNQFVSFKDEVKYILCLEEEAGTFEDPTGILDKVSSILGGSRPSKSDMDWYRSLNND